MNRLSYDDERICLIFYHTNLNIHRSCLKYVSKIILFFENYLIKIFFINDDENNSNKI